jgi:hypothetical protein
MHRSSCPALASGVAGRAHALVPGIHVSLVIASEAKQSRATRNNWIIFDDKVRY